MEGFFISYGMYSHCFVLFAWYNNFVGLEGRQNNIWVHYICPLLTKCKQDHTITSKQRIKKCCVLKIIATPYITSWSYRHQSSLFEMLMSTRDAGHPLRIPGHRWEGKSLFYLEAGIHNPCEKVSWWYLKAECTRAEMSLNKSYLPHSECLLTFSRCLKILPDDFQTVSELIASPYIFRLTLLTGVLCKRRFRSIYLRTKHLWE